MIRRCTRFLLPARRTPVLLTISNEYIPRQFPLKATTGLAGISVEPLWKPKLIAAVAELEGFLKASDIPEELTYYNMTMVLVRRVKAGIEACGDDWITFEKTYFWGWPVEFVLQLVWRELNNARGFAEARSWEIDPEQLRKVYKADGLIGEKNRTPWENMVRDDYDRRKKALSQQEMAELKRLDTEKMAREAAMYKERKEKVKDDMERARGDMLKKFLNKRFTIDKELSKMQPGKAFSGKTGDDLIADLKASASEEKKLH